MRWLTLVLRATSSGAYNSKCIVNIFSFQLFFIFVFDCLLSDNSLKNVFKNPELSQYIPELFNFAGDLAKFKSHT